MQDRHRRQASMGPWLRSHGREDSLRSAVERTHGYNGAVASQPRKGSWTLSGTASCLRFNGAVASQPRKAAGGGCSPSARSSRFNGAVASQPRKDRLHSKLLPDHVASMGPWLRSHGRLAPKSAIAAIVVLQWGRGFAATEGASDSSSGKTRTRFNGAVASQPRKAGTIASQGGPHARFNGAVASQPRKVSRLPHLAALNAASMGPWLRSHGRKENRIPPKDSAWLQWGRGFAATEGRLSRERVYPARSPASMGPWLRSHGRLPAAVGTPPRQMLQWGRGFAATEGERRSRRRGTARRFNGAVASQPRKAESSSMSSQSASCFNGAVASQPRKGIARSSHMRDYAIASMGPWLRSHGRMKSGTDQSTAHKLQWGRGFAATEGSTGRSRSRSPSSFNGAVASQPRKVG